MRTSTFLAVVTVAVAVGQASPFGTAAARAAESSDDVATDHISATDDGGPRTASVSLALLSMALGLVGANAGVALGGSVALSARVEGFARHRDSGLRAGGGLAIFPQRYVFHGIYVHPQVEWTHALRGHAAGSPAGIGAGLTVGYAWTWLCGAMAAVGAGMMFERGDPAAALATFSGLEPRVDANVGWVF